jgi:hypothetical protein
LRQLRLAAGRSAAGRGFLFAREAGNETEVRRKEMRIAMSNALALAGRHDFHFLDDFSSRDFFWLLIGVVLAVVVMWALSRRRRRWF